MDTIAQKLDRAIIYGTSSFAVIKVASLLKENAAMSVTHDPKKPNKITQVAGSGKQKAFIANFWYCSRAPPSPWKSKARKRILLLDVFVPGKPTCPVGVRQDIILLLLSKLKRKLTIINCNKFLFNKDEQSDKVAFTDSYRSEHLKSEWTNHTNKTSEPKHPNLLESLMIETFPVFQLL